MITTDHKWRMPATYLKVIMQEASAAHLPVESILAATDLTREALLTTDEPVSFANTLQVLSNAEHLLGPGWHRCYRRRPVRIAILRGDGHG